MTKNVFLWLYGGYGDCAAAYIQGGHRRGSVSWNKLTELKRNFPEINTKAIVISSNRQSISLVRDNPNIDNCIWIENKLGFNNLNPKNKEILLNSIHEHTYKYENIDSLNITQDLLPNENSIYLNQRDLDIYNNIIEQSGKKFILLHPFASINRRMPIPPSEYKRIIDAIIDRTEINIIVTGKSYTIERGLIKEPRKEVFDYQRKGLINIVNQIDSMTIITKLALKAFLVIGTWSAFSTIAMITGNPVIIYITPSTLENFRIIAARHFKDLNNITVFTLNNINELTIDKTIEKITQKLHER